MLAEFFQQAFVLMVQVAIALALLSYARATGAAELRTIGLFILAPFLGIGILFVTQRLIRTALEIYFTEYVITDRRTYSVTALISRRLNVIPFEKVTSLGVGRNLFERMIRVDRVHLRAYGRGGSSLTLRGVEETQTVFAALQRLARAHCSAENMLRAD